MPRPVSVVRTPVSSSMLRYAERPDGVIELFPGVAGPKETSDQPAGGEAFLLGLTAWDAFGGRFAEELAAMVGRHVTELELHAAPRPVLAAEVHLVAYEREARIVVGVGLEPGMASSVARAILGEPVSTDGVADLVGELANMAAGCLKRVVSQEQARLALGLPRPVDGPTSGLVSRAWRLFAEHLAIVLWATGQGERGTWVTIRSLEPGAVLAHDVHCPAGMVLPAGTVLTSSTVATMARRLGPGVLVKVNAHR